MHAWHCLPLALHCYAQAPAFLMPCLPDALPSTGSTKLTDEVVMERYKSLGPDAIIGITWHTKGQTDVHSGQGIVAFRTDKEMEQALAMGGFKVDEDAITVEKPTPLPAAASKGADFMET